METRLGPLKMYFPSQRMSTILHPLARARSVNSRHKLGAAIAKARRLSLAGIRPFRETGEIPRSVARKRFAVSAEDHAIHRDRLKAD